MIILIYLDTSTTQNIENIEKISSENEEEETNKTTVIGDMYLDEDQVKYLFSPESSTRLALGDPLAKWPNSTVIYSIEKSVDYKAKQTFMKAIEYIKNISCIRFEEKNAKTKHYILVKKGKACSSKVGFRQKGAQVMIIDGNLCSFGSILHELLHALSFLHMHTANNRDEYIEIKWANIRDDAKINFKSFSSHVTMLGTEYDYNSIMHYSNNAFAKNKKFPTIIAKDPSKAKNMGQRKGKRFNIDSTLKFIAFTKIMFK